MSEIIKVDSDLIKVMDYFFVIKDPLIIVILKFEEKLRMINHISAELNKEVKALFTEIKAVLTDIEKAIPSYLNKTTVPELFYDLLQHGYNSQIITNGEIAIITVHGTDNVVLLNELYCDNFLTEGQSDENP